MTPTDTGYRPRNRKASRMTQHTATPAVGRVRIAGLARLAGAALSHRIHSAADDRARAQGWQVTELPGPLGLSGRRYRDPRFGTRRSHQDPAARKSERHD